MGARTSTPSRQSGCRESPCGTAAMLDPDCLSAATAVLTNDAGVAEFDLTGDFSGFFDLRRPDLVPATLYPGHLLAGQMTASFPAYGIRPTEFQDLGLSADTIVILDPDAGVGHALVTIYDCQDHQASGISVTYSLSGPKAVPFYFSNGLPSTAATETDDFGLAGVVNVPAGTMMVEATPGFDPDTGRLRHLRRPPWRSHVRLDPGPIALERCLAWWGLPSTARTD